MDIIDLMPEGDENTVTKERIIIEARYYSEENISIPVSSQAYLYDLTVRKSIFLEITSDIFNDAGEATGEKKITEVETNNSTTQNSESVYETKIEKSEYNDFSQLLLSQLSTDIKNLSLHFSGDIDNIKITSEVMNFILSNFENVTIDFKGLSTWVTIPEINSGLKSLSIENANVEISQAILSCETSFTLNNIIIKAVGNSTKKPSLIVTAGKEFTLRNITISEPVFISASGSESKKFSDWKNTSVILYNIEIGFKDEEKNKFGSSDICDAILTIADFAYSTVCSVRATEDIPYYPLLSIKKTSEINMCELSRASKENPSYAPSLLLSDYYTAALSQCSYIGKVKSPDTVPFIRINNSRGDSELFISDSTIVNSNVISLEEKFCQLIAIDNSHFSSSNIFYKMDSSTISKLILNNVNMIADNLNIKSANLNILSETQIDVKEDVILDINEIGNISSSVIKSLKNIDIILSSNASLNIVDSSVSTPKELNVYTKKNEFEELSSRVDIIRSNFDTAKCTISDILSLKSSAMDLHGKECEINALAVFLDTNIQYYYNSFPITIKDSSLRQSIFSLYTPGSKVDFNILNCTGEATIKYLDDKNEKSVFNLGITSSPVSLHFDAVKGSRKINIMSKDSSGAVITGENDEIILVPDISCPDRLLFQRIEEKTQKDDTKILYGIIGE
jgi:hypothetical protein